MSQKLRRDRTELVTRAIQPALWLLVFGETFTRIEFLKRAVDETPGADTSLAHRVRLLENRLRDVQETLTGDPTRARRSEASPQTLQGRLQGAIARSDRSA